jgi:hypothetical protein
MGSRYAADKARKTAAKQIAPAAALLPQRAAPGAYDEGLRRAR